LLAQAPFTRFQTLTSENQGEYCENLVQQGMSVRWSLEDDRTLWSLACEGKSSSDLATRFKRSEKAIENRIKNLRDPSHTASIRLHELQDTELENDNIEDFEKFQNPLSNRFENPQWTPKLEGYSKLSIDNSLD